MVAGMSMRVLQTGGARANGGIGVAFLLWACHPACVAVAASTPPAAAKLDRAAEAKDSWWGRGAHGQRRGHGGVRATRGSDRPPTDREEPRRRGGSWRGMGAPSSTRMLDHDASRPTATGDERLEADWGRRIVFAQPQTVLLSAHAKGVDPLAHHRLWCAADGPSKGARPPPPHWLTRRVCKLAFARSLKEAVVSSVLCRRANVAG